MAKKIKNIGASVRARLLKLSKEQGQSFDLVLARFLLERLLFRLSQSRFADRFVLKGAMLLMSWLDEPHRGTRDLDLLGFGDSSPGAMLLIFREILTQDASDGVVSATFARRGTTIPVDRPDALSPAFAADELKQWQWRPFLEDAALNPGTLADVTDDLASFLVPHAGSAAKLRK
jgi:hypothetical protein